MYVANYIARRNGLYSTYRNETKDNTNGEDCANRALAFDGFNVTNGMSRTDGMERENVVENLL